MEQTGFWYVGPASAGLVARARPSLDAFGERLRADAAIGAVLDDWRALPDEVGTGSTTSGLASRFLQVFWAATIPENAFYAAAEFDIGAQTWDLSEDPSGHGYRAAFSATKRIPPLSVFFAGLAPQRAALLPGTLGLFALSPEEVATAADTVRKAHTFPPQFRADALERMTRLVRAAEAPMFPVTHLLDALVVVVGAAAANGDGLISVAMKS